MPPSLRCRARCGILVAALAALAGCSLGRETAQQGAGLGVGITAGTATGNPIIGLAAGVIASWSASTAFDIYEEQQLDALQQAIATATSDAEPGDVIGWAGGGHFGSLEVVREFGLETRCREIIFSRDDGDDTRILVATVCRRDDGWHWAVPQPRADLDGLF
ncbi:MAG: hypothetical protein R3F55_18115 [Alphaproteobacteria bacterium]